MVPQLTGDMAREATDEDRDDGGRYVEKYPLKDVEAAVEARDDATTGEVAEAVGCNHDTAYKKLRTLEEEGRVTSRKIGNARLWSAVKEDDGE